jgi:hypothetical protein
MIPTEYELGLIQNRKKAIVPIYLLNGASIEVTIETYHRIRDLIKLATKSLGVPKPEDFGVLEFVIKDQVEERMVDDNERVMDIVTSWSLL